MRNAFIFFLIILSSNTSHLLAQDNQPVVKVAMSEIDSIPMVYVKWFFPDIIMQEGVNIYRSFDEINWQKLNKTPIRVGQSLPSKLELDADSTLNSYMELASKASAKEITGFVKLMLLIKMSISHPFALYAGLAYNDKEVKKGLTYYYKVNRLVSGRELLLATSAPITVEKYKPENPPSDIRSKSSDASVYIKWKLEDKRFIGVNIYRIVGAGPVMQRMNKLPIIVTQRPDKDKKLAYPEWFYTDSNLKNGQSYKYQVAGIDYFGRETRYSDPMILTPQDTTAPIPPSYVRCRINGKKITVHWANSAVNTSAGYNIYRSIHMNREFIKLNSNSIAITDTAFEDEVPNAGKFYYYVEACDASHNCSQSYMTMADIPDVEPPSQPRMLRAIADTGMIHLTWEPNLEKDLKGYQMYRCIAGSGNEMVLLNAKPFAGTSFTDTLPNKAKNLFVYRVAAVDTSLNRGELSEPATARMPDIFPPQKPFIKNVYPDSGFLYVEWIPNVDLDLKGYNLYRVNVDSIKLMRRVNVELINPSAQKFTDKLADAGVKYYYVLQAIDSSGNKSLLSDLFVAEMPKPAIANSSAVSLVFSASWRKMAKGVEINWKNNDLANADGVIVFRRTGTDMPAPISGLLTEFSFVDKDVTKGSTYIYHLRLYLKSGAIIKTEEKTVKTE